MLRTGVRRLAGRGALLRAAARNYSADAANLAGGGAAGKQFLVSIGLGASAYAGGAAYALQDPDFRKTFEWAPGGTEALTVAQKVKDTVTGAAKQATDTVAETLDSVKKTTEAGIDSARKTVGGYTDATKKAVEDVKHRAEDVIDDVSHRAHAIADIASGKKDAAAAPPFVAPKASPVAAWKKSAYDDKETAASEGPFVTGELDGPAVPVEAPYVFEGVPVAVRLSAAVRSLDKELAGSSLPADRLAALKAELAKVLSQLSSFEKEQAILVGAVVEDQTNHFHDELHTVVENYKKSLEEAKTAMEASVAAHLEEARAQVAAQKDADTQLLLASQTAQFERTLREALSKQAEDMQAQWRREVRDRVDRERAGRLARLDSLDLKLRALERVAEDNGESAARMHALQRLANGVRTLREAAAAGPGNAGVIANQLAEVLAAGKDNELVGAVAGSVRGREADVLSTAELEGWWNRSVKQAVRRTGLMPDDGGVLSYSVSALLSFFIFPKSGLVEGDDVEAVVARSDYYLKKGDLDRAAREVNQLKGWSKRVAKDWLAQARKRLEVEQALQILETDVSLQELGVV